MKYKITFLLFFVLVLYTNVIKAQQMPIDFNEATENFTVFNGTTFSKKTNPVDDSDQVGEFKNSGANPWEGFFIDLQRPIVLSENQEILLDFYSFDSSSHNIILKLEDGGANPDVQVRVDLNSVTANQWITKIAFNFANAFISGTSNTISANGTYNKLVVFIDGGVTKSGTYLIDDIDDGSEPTDLNALDVEYTELVWSDEFNGASLDTEKWYHQTFGHNGGIWFNGEKQHYTNSATNSFVEDGNLHIVAKKETTTQNGETLDYTSARLNSKFAFTYGRVDIKAKLPEGNGTWPALWTLGKNITEEGAYWQTQGFGTTPWPDCGEIDIMEHGLHAVNEVSSALHTRSSFGATVNTATKMLEDVSNNYHVYSMNWSPNEIAFLVDDVVYYRYKKPSQFVDANNDGINDAWPFDSDQFLLLNVAMGGIAGAIDPNFTQSAMIIDYVRVYQGSNLSTEKFFEDTFLVYPNPAKDVIKIRTNQTIDQLYLYSVLGQLVAKTSGNEIFVSELPKGIYLLKIKSGNRIVTKKVVIRD